MALISMRDIFLAFSGVPIFDRVNLTIAQGEKVALVGRNGAGKSTLLRLIEESVKPDSGAVSIQRGAFSAYLSQNVPNDLPGTVFDVVASGTREYVDLNTRNPSPSAKFPNVGAESLHQELDRIHDNLDLDGIWYKKEQIDKSLSQLGVDAGRTFASLSAGLKRQVLLTRALVSEPDILLLDEPTNHMDIDSIKDLEQLMVRFPGALVFVTHDRMFLKKIATRILDIDRGRVFDQTCDYETFLVRRNANREAEETKNALFDRKLKKEENWIREGIKARRTRNEGRVRELEKMREMRSSRRERPGNVKIDAHEADRSGTLVAKAENIGFNYGDIQVISKFSATVLKGDRIGIIGPNGSGKTTLLRLLLGMLPPSAGTIHLGSNLQISYSDQLLEQLDENKTAIENVSGGNDTVTINGKPRHIIGYLQNFLFSPDQARSLVSGFSGGERMRLMLARLFTQPSNLLVLDEPTNDLDIETIDILEDLLIDYTGTILLVSHDRSFINNIVTSTVVFEDGSALKEYVGNYDDWLRQRPKEAKSSEVSVIKQAAPPIRVPRAITKLGFNQQKELDELPRTIGSLEGRQQELFQTMADPEFYKKDRKDIASMEDRLEELKILLDQAYARWEELEQLRIDIETSRFAN